MTYFASAGDRVSLDTTFGAGMTPLRLLSGRDMYIKRRCTKRRVHSRWLVGMWLRKSKIFEEEAESEEAKEAKKKKEAEEEAQVGFRNFFFG